MSRAKMTESERAMARAACMTDADWIAYRDEIRTLDQHNAYVERKKRAAERRELKAAIREVLDEDDN